MNINYASQNQGVVAWSGAAAFPVDLRHHVNYSFTFEVKTDIATEAVFNVQAAPASDADPCLPGTFVDVVEVLGCDWMTKVPSPQSKIAIPAGTPAGSICTGTLPCKPDAFIQLAAVSGDTANATVVVILSGPR